MTERTSAQGGTRPVAWIALGFILVAWVLGLWTRIRFGPREWTSWALLVLITGNIAFSVFHLDQRFPRTARVWYAIAIPGAVALAIVLTRELALTRESP